MRALLQRVSEARVTADGETVGEIGPGFLVLLGVGPSDDESTCRRLASKVARLRVFEDEAGRMNRSLADTGGAALVVSQFTLYADTSRGLRPSFTGAAAPDRARELYERFASELGHLGVPTRTGRFGARMAVSLVNSGPVTIMLDEPDAGNGAA
ncbi:MAG: D-aminoacyl-tRNA deacylase [bacterium]